jgi:hypothetical protein
MMLVIMVHKWGRENAQQQWLWGLWYAHKIASSSEPVFLNRRAAARYRILASIIPGPRVIEKIIYRAAVWQRLRNTDLSFILHRRAGVQNLTTPFLKTLFFHFCVNSLKFLFYAFFQLETNCFFYIPLVFLLDRSRCIWFESWSDYRASSLTCFVVSSSLSTR